MQLDLHQRFCKTMFERPPANSWKKITSTRPNFRPDWGLSGTTFICFSKPSPGANCNPVFFWKPNLGEKIYEIYDICFFVFHWDGGRCEACRSPIPKHVRPCRPLYIYNMFTYMFTFYDLLCLRWVQGSTLLYCLCWYLSNQNWTFETEQSCYVRKMTQAPKLSSSCPDELSVIASKFNSAISFSFKIT